MFGNNKILPPVLNDGNELAVVNIFATLQGEGIYAGAPAVFIRLGGCNLTCKFCDTDFDNFSDLPLDKIIEKVAERAKNNAGERARKLVVITGGEPLRQNISPLCEELINQGFKVQIETNGTLYRQLPDGVDIVCSPKNTSGTYAPIRGDLLPHISAIKFIISASHEKYQNAAEVGQSKYNIPVFLQPMDEGDTDKNHTNQKHALKLAMEHGYHLSLQLHKILEIE